MIIYLHVIVLLPDPSSDGGDLPVVLPGEEQVELLHPLHLGLLAGPGVRAEGEGEVPAGGDPRASVCFSR